MKLSIIIPTYNEKDNIETLVTRIKDQLEKERIKGEIIFVDDNSPDGTGKIIDKLSQKNNFVKVIHRDKKKGLGSAVSEGFKKSDSEIVGVMDADLSHPPEMIPKLFNSVAMEGNDLVVGSRYVNTGEIIGWSWRRKITSKIATFLGRLFTDIKDPMAGFFMVKRQAIKNTEFNSKGFKVLLELLVKNNFKKIEEVPITFQDRKRGESKMNFREITIFLKNILSYAKYTNLTKQFVKFGVVGVIGMIINLAVLYCLTTYLNIYYLLSAVIAFGVAVTNNYLLNKVWTFKERLKNKLLSKSVKFLTVSLIALSINIIFLYILTDILGIFYIFSQIISIGIAFVINFIGNKSWTFKLD